ncbi:MAG: TonB-dependent receptor [Methylacidiphilales bacterium]|nr:TonB-dependent receptor [Candidatus Methylacidiphilales bacterium]
MKKVTLIITALTMALSWSVTFAAESTLEEVTVTAQRKSENLQSVPVAITALTESVINRSDIHDLTAIALKTPSLVFAPFSPGQNIISLRGVSSNDDGAGTESSVAIFQDEVYLGRVSNINFEMGDLERIEVLRGPQGTLYGRNTLGGAINIITKKPSLDKVSGSLKITAGTYNKRDYGFLVSIPLVENEAAIKLSAQQKTRDGWIKDYYVQPDKWYNNNTKKLQDENSTNYRLSIYAKGDDADVLINYDKNTIDINDMGRISLSGLSLGSYNALYNQKCAPSGIDRQYCNASAVDGFAKRDAEGTSIKVTSEIDSDTTFTSITAIRSSVVDWEMDSVGGGSFYLCLTPNKSGPNSVPPSVPCVPSDIPNLVTNVITGALIDNIYDKTKQTSQEFRFNGKGDGYSYVVGLWYYLEDTDRFEGFTRTDDVNFGLSAATCNQNNYNIYFTSTTIGGCDQDWYRQTNETTSYAVFSQFDIDIGDNWSVKIGGRYTVDEKVIDSLSVDGSRFPFIISPSGSLSTKWDGIKSCEPINGCFSAKKSASWNDFSPKLVFAYSDPDGTNFYLSYARGFKSGGFPAAPAVPQVFIELKPETADSYELGVKADVSGNTRVNFSLFYNLYKNLQIQQFGPASPASQAKYGLTSSFGVFSTFNAADAVSRGIELEITWIPVESVIFNASLSLIDSEYTSDQLLFNGVNLKGRTLYETPEVKWDMGVLYNSVQNDQSVVSASLDFNYLSETTTDFSNPLANRWARTLANARLSWESKEKDFEVSLWVNNIFDTYHVIHTYSVGNGAQGVPGLPRMSGITLEYKF